MSQYYKLLKCQGNFPDVFLQNLPLIFKSYLFKLKKKGKKIILYILLEKKNCDKTQVSKTKTILRLRRLNNFKIVTAYAS